jgi:hypothetical protein
MVSAAIAHALAANSAHAIAKLRKVILSMPFPLSPHRPAQRCRRSNPAGHLPHLQAHHPDTRRSIRSNGSKCGCSSTSSQK